MVYYAHSRPRCPEAEWERLDEHLSRVAALASEFAESFGGGAYGRLAGLWHDLGKYSAEFQRYLRISGDVDATSEQLRGRIDHSTAGAQHAARSLSGPANRLIAYCIAGHHAGLPDWLDDSESCLSRRLQKTVQEVGAAPADLMKQPPPPMPVFQWATAAERHFQASVFGRMVFSSLVDADFLATEHFLSPERSQVRMRNFHLLRIATEVRSFLDKISRGAERTYINQVRQEVLNACLNAAASSAGLFSLTVPTGGGKTLSSLAFAVRHAALHGMQRIIYAAPFTSIIEQNADVFRLAVGSGNEDAVLEHHSATDAAAETLPSRLASENWDAPLIVTTNVQFFESFFAASSSRCRKLHRVVRSVIVLDEVQALPVQVLHPSLVLLRELVRNYHCSIVLCSATQPAVQRRDGFDIGLEDVRELVPNRARIFSAMKRTAIEPVGAMSDAALANALSGERQALCIVNTKRHAVKLFDLLPRETVRFHLSANMCPQHRSEVLATVKDLLAREEPCVVVSTQVIEAGVDIDFPTVFRAMTGVDSIAQAAGRCNREGRRQHGRVIVFEPEDPIPPGELRHAAESARELLSDFDDLLSPEAVDAYFSLHYWKRRNEWDRHLVLECFKPNGELDFRKAATRYRLIPEDQRPVVIPWGPRGRALADRVIGAEPPNRTLNRALQRFIVSTYRRNWDALRTSGAITIPRDQLAVLIQEKLYDRNVGLRLPATASSAWDPDELIV
jgi:CRISPR-associated endonuclease/helicase Cas3